MSEATIRVPLIKGNKTFHQITEDICKPLDTRPGYWWYITLLLSLGALSIGTWAIYMTLNEGLGTWGLNNTVSWGYSIINFVWWIGIGHAGTAFSIFLLILGQKWRTSINRAAEAMTVVAVFCAGIFPIIHMGKPIIAFYVFPYPNDRGPLWINFNSALQNYWQSKIGWSRRNVYWCHFGDLGNFYLKKCQGSSSWPERLTQNQRKNKIYS